MVMHTNFSNPKLLKGVYFRPPAGYADTQIPPTEFELEEFTLNAEIRNFGSMRNYWYPLPDFLVSSKSEVVQNPGW